MLYLWLEEREIMDVNTVFYKVGKNIKRIRKAKRITQDRLAAAAHMSISHLGYIERGKENPTLYTLYRISVALKIPLKELVDFDLKDEIPSTEGEELYQYQVFFSQQDPKRKEEILGILQVLLR